MDYFELFTDRLEYDYLLNPSTGRVEHIPRSISYLTRRLWDAGIFPEIMLESDYIYHIVAKTRKTRSGWSPACIGLTRSDAVAGLGVPMEGLPPFADKDPYYVKLPPNYKQLVKHMEAKGWHIHISDATGIAIFAVPETSHKEAYDEFANAKSKGDEAFQEWYSKKCNEHDKLAETDNYPKFESDALEILDALRAKDA